MASNGLNSDRGYGPGEAQSRAFVFFNVVNTITHLLLGVVTFVPLLYVIGGSFSASFNQHIILCVLGYQLLMAEAIMTFSRSNSWSAGLKYPEKKAAHWLLQVAGSGLALAGTFIRINALRNLSTPHGIIGLTAAILTIISLLGGVVNLFHQKLGLNPRFIKLGHAFCGSSAFILAAVVLCLGFDKAMFRLTYQNHGADLMIAFTVIAVCGSLVGATESMYRKVVAR